MRISSVSLSVLLACGATVATSQELVNPGFEQGWSGWTDVDPNKDATSISGHFLSGEKSAKIEQESGRFEQTVLAEAGSEYELIAHIKGSGTVGVEVEGEILEVTSEGAGEDWIPVSIPFATSDGGPIMVFGAAHGGEGRFDDFELIAKSGPALAAAEALAAGPREYTTIEGGCDQISQLAIELASDNGTSEDIHPPALAVDHDFNPDSRWSSENEGKELLLDLGLPHTVKEIGLALYKGNERQSFFEIAVSVDGIEYTSVIPRTQSGGTTTAIERFDMDDTVAQFVRITGLGNSSNAWNSIVETQIYGCGLNEIESTGDGTEAATVSGTSPLGFDLAAAPSSNFDLSDWKITIPPDLDGDGRADEIGETDLAGGWADNDYFYTDPVSGGMVFRSTLGSTTPNSNYPRSELREMLRAGDDSIRTRINDGTPNRNNWVFSSTPLETQALAGGVDGVLRATVSVDQVTRIGEQGKVGRVIIGQIHAKDDEPIRLYYRKLPFNSHGAIYYAHEVPNGDDVYVEIIGGRGDRLENNPDGILLGEHFSYEIAVTGQEIDGVVHPLLDVTITRADGTVAAAPTLDMVDSGYSNDNDFMYFKAGAYSQNDTSTWPERDFDQVTFYALENEHHAPPEN